MDQPHFWKADVATSVHMYNQWFLTFAPKTFQAQRLVATAAVKASLAATNLLTNVSPATIIANPTILPTLRMSTCPPLAVDRLIGLAGVNPTLVKVLDKFGRLPPRMNEAVLYQELAKIGAIIQRMADPDIFVWLRRTAGPTPEDIDRAATIIADRLCGSQANPIIRNEQEKRQLALMKAWLEARGYEEIRPGERLTFDMLRPGTFCFRLNVPVEHAEAENTVNIPIDAIIRPRNSRPHELPIMIEAKSAGDFTNTNKRRKEEAQKVNQLRYMFGDQVRFVLFLCGYFDSGYLGYAAADRIDWIWEHRIDDMAKLGL
jgi:type II restriction enzyme